MIPITTFLNCKRTSFFQQSTGVDGAFTAQLMENYPGTGNDSRVGPELRVNGNGTLLANGISGSGDGDNDEAEFYVSITQGYAPETIYGEGFD